MGYGKLQALFFFVVVIVAHQQYEILGLVRVDWKK